MTVGERIKNIRQNKRMTQKELGEKLGGISQQQIGQWENGIKKPKINTIVKIAKALDVGLFDLIDSAEYNSIIDAEVDAQIDANIKSGKIHVVTPDEQALTSDYLKLNDLGKTEARKRVQELTEITRYTAE